MEKLIRDKIHTTSHPRYLNMQTRKVADTTEHIGLLIAKIIEERQEFDIAIGIKKIEEAGDILEVYYALMDLYLANKDFIKLYQCLRICARFLQECIEKNGLDITTISRVQAQKREKRG